VRIRATVVARAPFRVDKEDVGGAGDDGDPPMDADGVGPGALIGRYVVEQEIARGAMGVVFRAYDPEVDRRVALKILREPIDEAAPAARARFVREARAMARLSHPNIVRVHDAGEVASKGGVLVYLAMDLVEGTTLRGWNAAHRSLAEVLAVFDAAGRGLAAAHAAGLVHRDFKPDNVLIDARGRVFVTDFGLVRWLAAAPRASVTRALAPVDDAAGEISKHGAFVGTPAYMAPEQLAGARVDDRADQFSFCVALWEAVYGARPFVGKSVDRLVSAVMRGEIAAVPAGRRVPGWLRSALLRGLAAHPGDRFPAIDALLDALRRRPARRRTLAWLAATAGAAAGAIAIAAWDRGRPCPHVHARAWDTARRAEIDGAASRWIESEAIAPTLVRALDDWAGAWRAAHVETCSASLVRGERSAAAWIGARACLERQDAAVDRMLATIEGGGVATGAEAVLAVHALGDPRACTGADADALPLAPRVLAVAKPDDDAHDEVSALRGVVEAATHAEGQTDLQHVVLAIEPLRSDRLAAHAWARLASAIAEDPLRTGEAGRWVTLAHAAVERGGGERRLHAEIDDARARGLLAADRPHEALDHARLALAAREAELGTRHPDVAASWLLVGRIDAARGDASGALADDLRALAILEDLFGARHPVAASVALRIADDLAANGTSTAAARWYARGLAGLGVE
jgi:serine/threonine protein kinase